MTDLSKTQLATILSALDGERRSPANKDAALKAIGQQCRAPRPHRRGGAGRRTRACSTAASTPRRGGRS